MAIIKPQSIKRRGFTLVEALLVLALLSLVVGLSLPIYQGLQVKTNLDAQESIIAQTLRRAQSLSRAMSNDSSWGVLVGTSTVSLFSGNSYAFRNANYDEIFDLPASVIPATTTEIVFSKYLGWPNAAATITLTTVNNDSRNLVINSQGMIEY